jgi:hypothetical protein
MFVVKKVDEFWSILIGLSMNLTGTLSELSRNVDVPVTKTWYGTG